jgi:Mn-containing catalase
LVGDSNTHTEYHHLSWRQRRAAPGITPTNGQETPMYYHDKRLQYPVKVEKPDPLFARQQWLAIIEDMGGLKEGLPVPNSFDQSKEAQEFSYMFMGTERNGTPVPPGRYSDGPSIDGKGQFHFRAFEPLGEEPVLGPARPDSGAQKEQMTSAPVTNSKT